MFAAATTAEKPEIPSSNRVGGRLFFALRVRVRVRVRVWVWVRVRVRARARASARGSSCSLP